MNMILNLEIMKKMIKLLYKGLQLFFILPFCLCSKKVFNYYWNKLLYGAIRVKHIQSLRTMVIIYR